MSNSQTTIIDTSDDLIPVDESTSLPELSINDQNQNSDNRAIAAHQNLNSQNTAPITIDSLNDVPVRISAVLGKKKIDVSTLLSLQKGTILDIDKKVGEPIDLYVNDSLVAHGELVMVNGCLGISMTEIIQNDKYFD